MNRQEAWILFFITLLVTVGIITLLYVEEQPIKKNDHCKTDSKWLPDWDKVSYDHHDGNSGDPEPIATSAGEVDIEWSRFPHDYPRGNQDSAGTIWKGMLFSTGGYCGGDEFPYWCRNRGFYTDTYLFNFATSKWNKVADMPGLGRQGHKCETVNDEVYCMGGFSYTSPYSHSDAYKYNDAGWTRIKDVPTNHTAATQICSMGDTIYLLESGYYNYANFYVSDKLFAYNTTTDMWTEISRLPGTPRWSTDITCIESTNEIYVLGGVSGNDMAFNLKTNSNNESIYKTIIDNWKYSVETDTWTRLSDTPLAIGNWMFQTYHQGYIFLIGGAGYMKIKNSTSVTIPNNLNLPHSPINKNIINDYLFTNNVYVYKVSTGEFIHSTPLPYDWNGPTVWLRDDTFYLAAGELGLICTEDDFFSRHPSMLLQGKITHVDI